MNSIEIIAVTLNESGEEEETVIKSCKNMNEAEQFMSEREQEFADDPDVYYVGIREQ